MPLRAYEQDQMFLLPPSLNEWVREDHPARVFSEIIDGLDTTTFREPKGEGRPAYHPKMMLKALLWGYATGVRSSRKIEERLEQDITFMWLAGLEKPDLRTLCLFRTNNKEALENTFTDVIVIAKSMGMASLGLVAIDGSKKKQKARERLYAKEDFAYDKCEDAYLCPHGEILRPAARTQFKGKYSKREVITYRTQRGICDVCALRENCTTNIKLGRAIIRDGYEEYRERMRKKINTAEGRLIYGKRKCLVEPVFGQIKTRGGFSQFLLRGLEKVRVEWKIAAIAHNLLKLTAAIRKEERILPALG